MVGLNRCVRLISLSIVERLNRGNVWSRCDDWSNVRSWSRKWSHIGGRSRRDVWSNIWSRWAVGSRCDVGRFTLVPDIGNVSGMLISDLVRHDLLAAVWQNNLK